jgi:hypothetical protein
LYFETRHFNRPDHEHRREVHGHFKILHGTAEPKCSILNYLRDLAKKGHSPRRDAQLDRGDPAIVGCIGLQTTYGDH